MAKRTISLTGSAETTYDLNTIEAENRTNSEADLVVQVFKYTKGKNPNPENPKIGQIWLSKLVTTDTNED